MLRMGFYWSPTGWLSQCRCAMRTVHIGHGHNKRKDILKKKTDGGAIDNVQINKLKSSVLVHSSILNGCGRSGTCCKSNYFCHLLRPIWTRQTKANSKPANMHSAIKAHINSKHPSILNHFQRHGVGFVRVLVSKCYKQGKWGYQGQADKQLASWAQNFPP